MAKYIVTHPEMGIYIGSREFGIFGVQRRYTLIEDPEHDGSDERRVTVFDSRRDAKTFIDQVFTGPRAKLKAALEIAAVDVEPNATFVSFDALRDAGFGHLLREDAPTPSLR